MTATSQRGAPSASAHRIATTMRNRAIWRLEMLNPLTACHGRSIHAYCTTV